MTDWARHARDREPGIVLAQEVPADPAWLGMWTDAGYEPTWGFGKPWRTRSVFLARDGVSVQQLTLQEFPTLGYHGSYVAAGRWLHRDGDPVIVASVHASPTPAEPERYGWHGRLPKARYGGKASRWRNWQLWDADLLLATLRRIAGHGLVAAGDFNEMLTGDPEGETWAAEYAKRVRAAGLTDVLAAGWGGERPTRFPPDGSTPVQLDHVLVDEAARRLVDPTMKPFVDEMWLPFAAGGDTGELSDHAPVWFYLKG